MYYSRCLLYFVALAAFSLPAYSAVTVEAVRVGSVYSGPSNQKLVDATLKTMSSTPGVPAKYVSRSVAITPASVGRLARGAMGGPLGLAVTAALIAEGLLIDNETGEIIGEPGETFEGECGWRWSGTQSKPAFEGPIAAVCAYARPESQYGCHGNPSPPSCASAHTVNCGGSSGSCSIYLTRVWNTGQWDTPASPATDSQISDALNKNPRVISDLINDLIQRRPSSIPTILPELASEMDATGDAQEAAEAHAADPETNPEPSPAQQEIVDNQTTTAPTMASEWPTFCSWATIVCDFIDWMRADPELPEHPPLPMLDIDIDDYDSALPATASCPAPVTVTTDMWGSFELSYQPFCDLAAYIRLALLGIAYLYAAYIVIGVRR